jgi:HlyD family secretion protein
VWKWIVGVLIVLVVLGGGAGLVLWKTGVVKTGFSSGQPQAVEMQLTAVERGDLIRTVSAPGAIEPRTNVKISSQVSAKVLALPFREGDRVKAGDVVVRLDPQDLEAILQSAQAAVRQQEAALLGAEASEALARLEYERLVTLAESGDVARAELDRAEANHKSAQSQTEGLRHAIDQARARITEAQTDLSNTVIASPMDGVITELNAEVGETVIVGTTNNPGSVILEIADLSAMLLKARVDETTIAPVRAGQKARVFINAYPDREYAGTVDKIGLKRLVAADGTGTFEVEILLELPPGETLYSGLTASTDIQVEEFLDVLRVPSQAVVERRVDELPAVAKENNPLIDLRKSFTTVCYRVVDGKTVATVVKVGPSDLTHTVIEDGLGEGDRVVSGPYRELVAIAHDKPVKDAAAPKDAGNGAAAGANAVASNPGNAGGDAGAAPSEGDPASGGAAAAEPEAVDGAESESSTASKAAGAP